MREDMGIDVRAETNGSNLWEGNRPPLQRPVAEWQER